MTGADLAALCAASGCTVESFAHRIGVAARQLRQKQPIDFSDNIRAVSVIDQLRHEAIEAMEAINGEVSLCAFCGEIVDPDEPSMPCDGEALHEHCHDAFFGGWIEH